MIAILWPSMQVSLSIIRYKKRYIFFAFMAMAFFRIPLWMDKRISFYKLLGCGKNGTFDKVPDLQQWGILTVRSLGFRGEGLESYQILGNFISSWLRFFKCEVWTILLEPLEGHGSWNGKKPFGELSVNPVHDGPIAVLTWATIRLHKLKYFWQEVAPVTAVMKNADGFITSLGIGEIPWIKQATFSVWESKEAMKNFAYGMRTHTDVIKKTREQQWYSEEMFVRFKIIASKGTIQGINPVTGKP